MAPIKTVGGLVGLFFIKVVCIVGAMRQITGKHFILVCSLVLLQLCDCIAFSFSSIF